MLLPDTQIQSLLARSGVSEEALRELQTFARNARITLQEAVIQKDTLSDEKLGVLIADYLKVPFIIVSRENIPEDVFRIIPERVGRKYKVVAFARGQDSLKVSMADPTNADIMRMIVNKTKQNVTPYFSTERDIESTFHLYKKNLQQTFNDMLHEVALGTDLADNAPIAKMVDLIITHAYRDRASDIHIEPEEKNFLVRFRIDGILHDVFSLEKKLHERVITRIKVLSRLRTDEHLSAQDGKMRMRVDDEDLDLRVSILPVADGEKAVLRLLSSHFRQFSLLDLGMGESDLRLLNSTINKPYGMILSTGPTGSGKTTTIYAILKILNTREKNITTVEDPVEYKITGVNQIQVNTKTNLTFANGLKSILRQDPNVIFVGEIRDSETAEIAVNAALTGHLVVSTLHTNDAATTLPRLIDMNVEPFLVASTVNLIVAQRLVRRICEACKTQVSISRESLLKHVSEQNISSYFQGSGELVNYSGTGCKVCNYTGYVGRIGVFEVLKVSEELKRLISSKSDSDVITKAAVSAGMTTIFDDGLSKAGRGITTIEEVLRVVKVEKL